MFEIPAMFDYHVNHWYSDAEIESLAEHIKEVEEYKKNV